VLQLRLTPASLVLADLELTADLQETERYAHVLLGMRETPIQGVLLTPALRVPVVLMQSALQMVVPPLQYLLMLS